MLKKIRQILAVVFFAGVTLLFLDFTGTLHKTLGWMAKLQFIPAVLAVNVSVVLLLVALTLLFGRLYCSVICPLGVFQDGVSNLSARRKGKKNRFRYSPAMSWLRYGVLALFVVMLVAGLGVVVSLLDPYGAYGRMASNFLSPVYRLGNNLLAFFAEQVNSYAFYSTDVWIKGWITFSIAVATLGVVGFLAWRSGRTYCNTVCPVGTVLGFLSRFSLFRMAFDTEKCTRCNACERRCKSSCIDVKTMTIDHSRCVACFNCIERCKFGAMNYVPVKWGRKTVVKPASGQPSVSAMVNADSQNGMSRRKALSAITLLAAGTVLKAQEQEVEVHGDGGLAEIIDKKIIARQTPIVPPGSLSARHMKQHCTACQLCVSACPNNILRPSDKLTTLMQPEMSYERGYCRPECVECSQVCPTGAIKPISAADKSAIAIGLAVWVSDRCVVNTDEVQCHNCQRHCPTGAITLVALNPDHSDSLKVPAVDKELCIGCGACENLCPARPYSAIYVEGNARHHQI